MCRTGKTDVAAAGWHCPECAGDRERKTESCCMVNARWVDEFTYAVKRQTKSTFAHSKTKGSLNQQQTTRQAKLPNTTACTTHSLADVTTIRSPLQAAGRPPPPHSPWSAARTCQMAAEPTHSPDHKPAHSPHPLPPTTADRSSLYRRRRSPEAAIRRLRQSTIAGRHISSPDFASLRFTSFRTPAGAEICRLPWRPWSV